MAEFIATVSGIKKYSDVSDLVKFKLKEKFDFKPGQFISIHHNEEERPFSIASAPGKKGFELLIRKHPDGKVTPWLCELKKGSEVNVSGPYGSFTIRENENKEIIFICAGTGIAPFRGMAEYILKKYPNKKLTLIFGFREECYFKQEFKKLQEKYPNFLLVPSCSKPDKNWKGFVGRVTEHLEGIIKTPDSKDAYICGPKEMVESAKEVLLTKLKFDKEHIHIEEWS
jgi:NAD(P)H-flavin reductase